MSTTILYFTIIGVIGVAIGYIIAKMIERSASSKIITDAEKSAATIIKDAKTEGESIKKDKILQAKEKFIELKQEPW